jgi:hypothetical protein
MPEQNKPSLPDCAMTCSLEDKIDKITATLESVKEELENVPIIDGGDNNIIFKRKEFDQLIYNKLSPSFAFSKVFKVALGFIGFVYFVISIIGTLKILSK